MQPGDPLKKLILTFSTWQNALDNYSLYQLHKKPDEQSWSIGQVYMHLIEQTINHYIPKINDCISSNDHTGEIKSEEGKEIFRLNSFPSIRLKSPAEDPEQPESIEEIRQGLNQIRKQLTDLTSGIADSKFSGKAKHPGFGYLNVNEWILLIDMHFRHHLHQKSRLDAYLSST
jgi:hypothetical protein